MVDLNCDFKSQFTGANPEIYAIIPERETLILLTLNEIYLSKMREYLNWKSDVVDIATSSFMKDRGISSEDIAKYGERRCYVAEGREVFTYKGELIIDITIKITGNADFLKCRLDVEEWSGKYENT